MDATGPTQECPAGTSTAPARAAASSLEGWLLRVAVTVQCLGAAWWFEHASSAVGSYVLVELGRSVEAAGLVDRSQSIALVVGAFVALLRPRPLVLLAIGALFALEALAHGIGDERFSRFAPFAAGMRIAAPCALAVLVARRPRANAAAEWILKIGITAAFVAHGLEAWLRNPVFIDLVLAFDLRLGALGPGLGESDARTILVPIAIHDWLLPVALLATRWRWIPIWMGIWGGAAAVARVVQGGLDLWPEVALRASHGLVPLAVAALLVARARDHRRC